MADRVNITEKENKEQMNKTDRNSFAVDKKSFARWYIESDVLLRDSDVLYLKVGSEDFDEVRLLFGDFKFQDGKMLASSETLFDNENEEIILKFFVDHSKEEYRVDKCKEADSLILNHYKRFSEEIDYYYYKNDYFLKKMEMSFVNNESGFRRGDSLSFEGNSYKVGWIFTDIRSSTDRIYLIPENGEETPIVVRYYYAVVDKEKVSDIDLHKTETKIYPRKDNLQAVPVKISTELAGKIVDFMENYETAFGYSDEIEGQADREGWIETIRKDFLETGGEAYLKIINDYKETTVNAEKEAGEIIKAIKELRLNEQRENDIERAEDRVVESEESYMELEME